MFIKPLFCEWDLVRARRILGSWTSPRRLSSDEADIIVRMIAQGIAEGRRYGFELAEAELGEVLVEGTLAISQQAPGNGQAARCGRLGCRASARKKPNVRLHQ